MDPLLRHTHMQAPTVSSISSCCFDCASLANLSATFLHKSVVAVSRICTFGCYWTCPPEDNVCCWLTRVTRTSARTPTARWQRRTMQSCWSTAPRAWSRRRASFLRSYACGVCLPPDKTYMHKFACFCHTYMSHQVLQPISVASMLHEPVFQRMTHAFMSQLYAVTTAICCNKACRVCSAKPLQLPKKAVSSVAKRM